MRSILGRETVQGFIDVLFHGREDIKVIQVGVNDGVNADFLKGRIEKFGWSGLMIEPHPAYIEMAKRNYGDNRRLIWENVAISNVSGSTPLYYVKDPPEDWVLGIASFSLKHVEEHGFSGNQIADIRVPCLPLRDLIERHGFHEVDLVVVDVEGHETNVFQSIDFTKFSTKLVVLETAHFDRKQFRRILGLFPASYRGVYDEQFADSVIYNLEPVRGR